MVVELVFESGQNGASGGAAGFAVIAEAVLRAAFPCPTIMRGRAVAVLLQKGRRFRRRINRRGQRNKAAFADFFAVFARGAQGESHELRPTLRARGGVKERPRQKAALFLPLAHGDAARLHSTNVPQRAF